MPLYVYECTECGKRSEFCELIPIPANQAWRCGLAYIMSKIWQKVIMIPLSWATSGKKVTCTRKIHIQADMGTKHENGYINLK